MTSKTLKLVSGKAINMQSPPMVLFQKAKKYGIWNPADIDYSQDREDWSKLNELEQEVLLRLTALFQSGEEAVTLELLPLIMVMAKEGRVDEEMFLASFLWEEAKHVEAFGRFFQEVIPDAGDLSRFLTPSYAQLFDVELHNSMNNLLTDSSPAAVARASVTYNMIVEGMLAEAGYNTYYKVLDRNGIMPGLKTLLGKLKQDESRHIAYGVFLLSRLVAEHGEPVWLEIEKRMNQLFQPAIGIINEGLALYETLPFGLTLNEIVMDAMTQFQRRFARIQKAKSQTLEEVCKIARDKEQTVGSPVH